ncbi:MAG: cytidylate kinase, partial [Cyclobacteriaceae bacterium]
RATTLFFLRKKVDWSDLNQIKLTLEELKLNFLGSEIILNSEDVSDEIRSMKVNEAVSHVAAIKIVRLEMVRQQQQMGAKKGVVMDGRDIGTVVFPLAELKIFMIANAEVRALRRQSELSENGVVEELYVVKSNLLERDRIDSSRLESPLVKADDAIEMDTSNLSFDEQVRKIVEMAKTKINES